jgi:hypothetical protein
MKNLINEAKRMQKLAGMINENQQSKSLDIRQLVKEVIESEINEKAWPFPSNSETVIRDAVDRFIDGEKGIFDFLASRAGNNEQRLNIILDMIKEKLNTRSSELAAERTKSFQARFGPSSGQETAAGTYTGD